MLDTIIDHGINLSNFIPAEKSNQFIIVSQLIERKRIDKSIIEFIKYNELVDSKTKLYIAGNGDQLENLQNLAKTSKYPDNIIFLGKLKHNELINYLAKSYAMLIYTTKDNNLISVVESLACNTPIVTNSVPYNATYIKNNGLGIVDDNWDYETLKEIVNNNAVYCNNCNSYREILSYDYKVKLFMNVYDKYIKS